MKTARFFFIFLLMSPLIVRAEITQLQFTTEPQTIEPGVMSETLTIQTQDSAGVKEDMIETGDLVFVSSSPTGEFLSASGGPVSTTMSKNSANRNFFYRDSAAGTYTLSVTLTGRTSGQSWQAMQSITVGTGGDIDSGDDDSVTTIGPISSGSSSSSGSTHNSPTEISKAKEPTGFGVSIGRDRSVVTGSRLLLRATAKGLDKNESNPADYFWNFGDGSSAHAPGAYHVYRSPGTYNVVMDLTQGDNEAVARLTVMVTDPKITLVRTVLMGESAIELKNTARAEINLGEWRLEAADQTFALPPNTIFGKGATITVPFLGKGTVRLVAPSGQVFAELMSEAEAQTLAELQRQLNQLLAVASQFESPEIPTLVQTVPEPESAPLIATSSPNQPTTTTIQLAPKRSWWQAGIDAIFR